MTTEYGDEPALYAGDFVKNVDGKRPGRFGVIIDRLESGGYVVAEIYNYETCLAPLGSLEPGDPRELVTN